MLFKKKVKEVDDNKIKVNTSTITTFVGKDSVFTGSISTEASLRIDGEITGDIRSKGVVIISQTGKVAGTIEAESILVAGVVEGNMSIRDKVNVEPTGQIYGEIITKKFVIDEESIFQGNCIMNREGKYIPVTPLEKPEEEKASEEKAEEEKKEQAGEKEENTANEKSVKTEKKTKKNRKRTDKREAVRALEELKKAEEEKAKAAESKEDTENKESEEKTEKKDVSSGIDKKESETNKDNDLEAEVKSEEEDTSKADNNVDEDDDIEIADIDEINMDDNKGGSGYIDRQEVSNLKNNNYIRTTKSLSVEIERKNN